MAKKKQVRSTKLVQLALSDHQSKVVNAQTPEQFIRTRKGKGKKDFSYVEVGYIISRLNGAFSPCGWDFEVVEQEISEKEVWVKGKLIIKDHKGHEVSKTQFGQASRTNMSSTPLGDVLKSASSDCLKKCASMLGIALDVYWNQLDEMPDVKKEKKKVTKAEAFKLAVEMIKSAADATALVKLRDRIFASDAFTDKQKSQLVDMIEFALQNNE